MVDASAADDDPQPPPAASNQQPGPASSPLTRAGRDLLSAADAGGVPMFTSRNLRRIAAENGIDASPDKTPNQLLAELRAKAPAASGPDHPEAASSGPVDPPSDSGSA